MSRNGQIMLFLEPPDCKLVGDIFKLNIKNSNNVIIKSIFWQDWVSKLSWRLSLSYCLLVVEQYLKIVRAKVGNREKH